MSTGLVEHAAQWIAVGRNQEGGNDVRSRTYEWIPFRMWIPAIPRIADGPLPVDEIRTRQEILLTGRRTVVCTTERATSEAQKMIEACKARVERGESWAVTELLDANPAFIADRWVRQTLGEMVEQRRPLRRRGRPRASISSTRWSWWVSLNTSSGSEQGGRLTRYFTSWRS